MAHTRDAALFTDENFVWVEPALKSEPTLPTVVPAADARPVNAPPSPKVLQAGDRTAAVADLQQALAALGLYSGGVDGDFGDSTAAAVSAFQSQRRTWRS